MKEFGTAFGLVGLGFLIAATWFLVDRQQFIAGSQQATGQVTEIKLVKSDEGDSYIPVINYITLDGKTVSAHPNITLSPPYGEDQFSIGQKISIRYDPHDPAKILMPGFFENWGLILIFGSIGLVLFPLGCTAFYVPIRKRKTIEWLRNHGEKIEADFNSIQLNESTTRKKKHPYTIVATWIDTSKDKTYTFHTEEDIWEDPSSLIPVSKKIQVLVDPKAPEKKYWIDPSPFFLKTGF
jgi:hypothetical protein